MALNTLEKKRVFLSYPSLFSLTAHNKFTEGGLVLGIWGLFVIPGKKGFLNFSTPQRDMFFRQEASYFRIRQTIQSVS